MKRTSQCIDWAMVRNEIKRSGQSQAAVAEICGVSRETFNRMLNGSYDSDLSFDFVDRLAAMLGMSVYQLFEVRPLSSYYYQKELDTTKLEAHENIFASISKYVEAMK